MDNTAPNTLETYRDHAMLIKKTAESFRAGDLDIDQIIPALDKALVSYAFCKERIESVRKMLGDKLPDDLR
ncbi:MAG: hypothetical protein M0041_06650 [Nitrospiraceae bacterium]|jgi:hypothetical protein|nr:hypothetical protein [Nitrospiraceae bacterium]